MESLSFKFNMEDQRPIFPLGDTKPTITDGFTASDAGSIHPSEAVFTPMSSQFQGRTSNELLNLLAQEPRAADTAPSTCEIDMSNFRISSSDVLFEDTDSSNLFMEGGRTESVASSANQWGNTSRASPNVPRNNEMMDTFEFLVKSLSSANNYVSMLTREQLQVMRAIRPGLLYEFLQEVAKVRSDKRMRRAFSHECAFCKNNGESEECYMTHALKDWRGRVTCPVLRAFHCPRCGATGDRAHTIKYCPENDGTSDRSSFTFRRRVPSSASLLLGPQQSGVGSGMRSSQPPTPTPAQSPSAATAGYSQSSLWSTFRMN